MLISILIDCSFHSYCPCLHCFSHHYSVACFASIVVVVPVLDTRHWTQSDLFEFCYRPSRDFRLAPPFPLIVRKGTERGSAVRSVRTSRGFAVLDLLLPLLGLVVTILFLHRCCAIPDWRRGSPSMLPPVSQDLIASQDIIPFDLASTEHLSPQMQCWNQYSATCWSIFLFVVILSITLLLFLFVSHSILQFRLELLALSVLAFKFI